MRMIRLIRKVWGLLSSDERKKGYVLAALMLIVAFFDLVGIGSIFPFLSVLMDTKGIHTNSKLSRIYQVFNFDSEYQFLVVLGLAAFFLLVFSSIVRSLQTYALNRFSMMRQHSIGSRILKYYLAQPYEFFLNRNSAELSRVVLSETSRFVGYCLQPLLLLMSQAVLVVVLVLFLLMMYPSITAVMMVVFGGIYFLLYHFSKKRIQHHGVCATQSSEAMYRITAEVFGGVKEFKLLGKEQIYFELFSQPSFLYAHHSAANIVLSQIPKYFIEAAGFGSIILISLLVTSSGQSAAALIPTLGLFAFVSYKLLPSLQSIYFSLNSLSYAESLIETLEREFLKPQEFTRSHMQPPLQMALPWNHQIELKDVSYAYPNTKKNILNKVSLVIRKGQSIGIRGETGSGKSTLVDIILGLLRPTSGVILIDGNPLSESTLRAWQAKIAYVPQSIFLADSTIAQNIAFGIPKEHVNDASIERAGRLACIHDWVLTLPEGYQTVVGDRGVRLSGGQRQRIGIARALYLDSEVLVLDEATSALDQETEHKVITNINSLGQHKTLIMIAHRVGTLNDVDRVIMF